MFPNGETARAKASRQEQLGYVCKTVRKPFCLGQEGKPLIPSPYGKKNTEGQAKPEAGTMRRELALVMVYQGLHPLPAVFITLTRMILGENVIL